MQYQAKQFVRTEWYPSKCNLFYSKFYIIFQIKCTLCVLKTYEMAFFNSIIFESKFNIIVQILWQY